MLVLLAFLISQAAAPGPAPTPPPSVVILSSGAAQICSGVFVTLKGRTWLLTANHCFDNPTATGYSAPGGATADLHDVAVEGAVVRFGALDLAMIPMSQTPSTMKIGSGDPIRLHGFPGGSYAAVDVKGGLSAAGNVCSTNAVCQKCAEAFTVLGGQLYATVEPASKTCVDEGHSGGAVVNRDGELVGIVSSRSGTAMAYLPVEKIPDIDIGPTPTYETIAKVALAKKGLVGTLIEVKDLAAALEWSGLFDRITKTLRDRRPKDLELILKDLNRDELQKNKPRP